MFKLNFAQGMHQLVPNDPEHDLLHPALLSRAPRDLLYNYILNIN